MAGRKFLSDGLSAVSLLSRQPFIKSQLSHRCFSVGGFLCSRVVGHWTVGASFLCSLPEGFFRLVRRPCHFCTLVNLFEHGTEVGAALTAFYLDVFIATPATAILGGTRVWLGCDQAATWVGYRIGDGFQTPVVVRTGVGLLSWGIGWDFILD